MNTLATASRIKSDLLGPRALNPQPLPPRSFATTIKDLIGPRALNPQPLPPKAVAFEKPDLIGPRALNPQPLPPRDLLAIRPRFNAGEFVSFEPKAEPTLARSSHAAMSNVNRSQSLAQILSRLFGAMIKA